MLNDGIIFLVPWWAEVHIFIGFVVFYWILTPILYYTNVCSLILFFPNQSHLLSSLGISPTSPSPQTNLLTDLVDPTISLAYCFQTTHSTKLLTTFILRFISQLLMLWLIFWHSLWAHLYLCIRRCIMGKVWWMGWRRLELNVMTFMPSWCGIIQRYRNGGILVLFVSSFVWLLFLWRWVSFFSLLFFLGRMANCVFFFSIGLAYGCTSLGLVALCTTSDHLYPTFWIHLCHDGSRCTILHLSQLVQPPSDHISADIPQCPCTNHTRNASSW